MGSDAAGVVVRAGSGARRRRVGDEVVVSPVYVDDEEPTGNPLRAGTAYRMLVGVGTVVTCGSSTGYRHEFDNRYLWMRLKRIIGSHGADLHEQAAVHRLLDLGRLGPALTTTYPLHETAEAARLVQRNLHLGKVGVLALAPGRVWGGRGTTPGSRVRVVPHINAYGVRPLSGGRPCASSSPEPPATSAARSPTG
ncbi:zinc-binding dehydrogenase [Streptomyces sp. AN091965]|uniref:zinc-binding dehydrogenase n=1 Tax=Streptomyces sp. AN091965 TaxID=2927803 RepID=UPI0035A8C394